ncbi:hypothetical protein [Nonlabens antarcticus]|uniref:hypothetical protein n=1 Tax=Nonlabens antarcticus TaxID=392714 RepID=UPI00189167B3|nr:hypothetical protein [Nonlabens antarcticus]
MRLKAYLTPFLLITTFVGLGQVGINNTSPTAALDVIGNVKVNEKLFMENPGDFNKIRGSKLLIQKTDKSIVQYDIDQSKYGPINYAQLIFKKTGREGVQNYNTKISTTDYSVTVQGFYFREFSSNSTNVLSFSTAGDDFVEGFQAYAYKNNTTDTWWVKAFINNGYFRTSAKDSTFVDIYMNLIIFRNGLIAKPKNNVIISMGGATTKTVAPPAGFK